MDETTEEQMSAATMGQGDAEFLKVKEAAALVRGCASTIRDWMRKGKLRRYGEGRLVRVRRAELLALMERGGSQATSEEDVAASILGKRGH